MKNKFRTILSLLLSFAMVATLGSGYIPGRDARAEGGGFQDLNQQEIVQAMGAGWNLGNQLEASSNGTPQEDAWTHVKVTEKLIRSVKEKGFQSIRIPVSWLSMIGEAPEYAIDGTWMDRVQQVVDWAVKYDLYTIINVHGDGYPTVDGGWILATKTAGQAAIKEKFGAVWKQIAERFKGYDQHLIFESMNEVGADATTVTNIKKATKNINAYNQVFVDTVRQTGGNNDKRWLLIPGVNTNISYTVDAAGTYGFQIPEDTHRSAEIPENEKRIMISVHYYTPWEFCGQEDYGQTQWGYEADVNKSVGYGAEEDLEAQFASLKSKFTDLGYPVVIGEYGAVDKSKKESGSTKKGEPDPANNDFRAYYAWKVCSQAKQDGCIPVYWDNGWNGDLGFAIFSRGTEEDKKLGYEAEGEVTQPKILEAIISNYSSDEGNAKGIALDKKAITMDVFDSGQQLVATQTPADAGDTVIWECSDTSVAAVDYKGKVRPRGAGTCLVTATVPGGASAYCIVNVTAVQGFTAGLYAQASNWGTMASDYATISESDGAQTCTLSISGNQDLFKPFYTLFIKDALVQNGMAEKSNLKRATFNIKSAKFNEKSLTVKNPIITFDKETTTADGVLDLCLLNAWYTSADCIAGLQSLSTDGKNTGYAFEDGDYVDGTNTLTIELEVTRAVLDLEKKEEVNISGISLGKTEMKVGVGRSSRLSPAVTPENATETVLWFSENPKVARVNKDGSVAGVKEGEAVIHALTLSGLDETCKVQVVPASEAPTEEPPSAAPSTNPSAMPSSNPSADPSAVPSVAPSANPSAVPSSNPSANPSAGPSAVPSAAPSDPSATPPTGGKGNTAKPDPAGTNPKKGDVFVSGKLKYKVTNATAGKLAVAVQASKSKSAKSLSIPASVKKGGASYSVTSVGASAFKNCKKLKKITIGKNVTSIGKNAFRGCKALKKITVKTTKLKKVGKNALKGIHKKAVVKVPKKKLKKYRKLWKKKGQRSTVKIN